MPVEPKRLLWALLVCASVLFSAGRIAYNAANYDWPAGDEHWHYAYSERFLKTGETERQSIPNYISTTPSVVLNVLADQLGKSHFQDERLRKLSSRSIQLLWYLLLCSTVYAFARRLFDEATANWATLLTSLDISLSGHASIIGMDVPFACAFLWCLWASMAYLWRPGWFQSLLIGTTLAIAFAVKYLAIFAVPVAVVCIIWAHVRDRSPVPRNAAHALANTLTMLLAFTLIENAAYGFADTGFVWSERQWSSSVFRMLAEAMPGLSVPFPMAFISGFDLQLLYERSMQWNTVIFNETFPSGVWYYFPVMWLLKTPLAMLSVVVLGFAACFVRLPREDKARSEVFLLLAVLLALGLYFMLVFRTQVGLRYVYMCLPVVYILAARGIGASGRSTFGLGLGVFLLVLVETGPYWSNPIAFTNHFIANKAETYRYLGDSNVDWFQNYGNSRRLATEELGDYAFNPPRLVLGNNLFSLNVLAGVMRNFQQHAWIREHLAPVKHYDYTVFLFHVDQKNLDAYNQALPQ